MESPIALHALVYAMLRTVTPTRTGAGPETMLSLQHYAACLAKLRREMRHLDSRTVVPDNLIIAIAALSMHGEQRAGARPSRSTGLPPSPLAKTQNIHVYGSAKIEADHMRAVYELVNTKGGLGEISLDGLPDVLEV